MKKGFTLIELLVVVAIIGILATVVVVNLSSSQNKARNARIANDLGQISNAAQMILIFDGTFAGSRNVTDTIYGMGDLNVGSTTVYNIASADTTTEVSYQNFKEKDATTPLIQAPSHPLTGSSYIWNTNLTSSSDKYYVYARTAASATNFMYCKTGKACDLTGNITGTVSANAGF